MIDPAIFSSQHAPLSASGAHRWMNCPGSAALSKDIPSTAGIDAHTGTLAHWVVAELFKSFPPGRHQAACELLGLAIEHEGVTYTVDHEMCRHAINFIELLEKDFPGAEYANWSELSLHDHIRRDLNDDRLGGTADFVALHRRGNACVVVDYKYGKGVSVSPFDNFQLLMYLVGAYECGFQYGPFEPWDEPDGLVGIYQPRVKDGLQMAVVSFEEYRLFRKAVLASLKAIDETPDKFILGEWCRWCPAKAICPAITKQMFAPIETDPRGLDDINFVVRILEAAEGVKSLIKSAEEKAIIELQSGRQIPGWTLTPTRPTRVWTEDAPKALDKMFGPDAYVPQTLKSPSQMEKGLKKAEKEKLKPYTAYLSSGVKLTRQKRDTVPSDKLTNFELLDD